MTTMRVALTMAAGLFDIYGQEHRLHSSNCRAVGMDDHADRSAKKAKTAETMTKMCRDALSAEEPKPIVFTSQEDDAARNFGEEMDKINQMMNDLIAKGIQLPAPAFFCRCAECQWPNICGKTNPCTLASLGIDPAKRSRFDRIAGLTADQWDGMVKSRQVLPTHRHERSGYKLQPPIFITTEFEAYIVP